MTLNETLLELSRHHTAALSPPDRADFEDQLDRLRMMRVAEEGLGVGDYLPDFALDDGAGRTWTSSELLDLGPLVLALFRGDWCPYCDLTMAALEQARPAIEALGANAVGVMPDQREHVTRTSARRGIGFTPQDDRLGLINRGDFTFGTDDIAALAFINRASGDRGAGIAQCAEDIWNRQFVGSHALGIDDNPELTF